MTRRVLARYSGRCLAVSDFIAVIGAGSPASRVRGPFFLDLGANGRRYITCHEPQSNMTVTPARLRARFEATELSLFRRPPPATNLGFLSTVMWDSWETVQDGLPAAIHFDLAHQSNAATEGHAERPRPIDDITRDLIVAYELGLYTAQVFDHAAGELFAAGGEGGSGPLSDRIFVFGVNDPLGCDPKGAICTGSDPDFTSSVFTEYAAWDQRRGGSEQKKSDLVVFLRAL